MSTHFEDHDLAERLLATPVDMPAHITEELARYTQELTSQGLKAGGNLREVPSAPLRIRQDAHLVVCETSTLDVGREESHKPDPIQIGLDDHADDLREAAVGFSAPAPKAPRRPSLHEDDHVRKGRTPIASMLAAKRKAAQELKA